MDGHVKGFDCAYWDGELEDPTYRFCYIKLTDGIWGDAKYMRAENQYLSAKAQGREPGFFHFWRYLARGNASPKQQAEWVCKWLSKYPTKLPPALDFEDRYAPKFTCASKLEEFGYEFNRLWDAPYIIYTATWWWNDWVGLYYPFKRWNPYLCELWESDPPPDTKTPGKWKDYDVLQYKLDAKDPAFNAMMDLDWAREAWWEKYITPSTPIPQTLEEKVDILWEAHPELHGAK